MSLSMKSKQPHNSLSIASQVLASLSRNSATVVVGATVLYAMTETPLKVNNIPGCSYPNGHVELEDRRPFFDIVRFFACTKITTSGIQPNQTDYSPSSVQNLEGFQLIEEGREVIQEPAEGERRTRMQPHVPNLESGGKPHSHGDETHTHSYTYENHYHLPESQSSEREAQLEEENRRLRDIIEHLENRIRDIEAGSNILQTQ